MSKLPCPPGGDFQFRFNVLPSDASGDGIVNAGDFTAWANKFGIGTTFEQGDFNGDGLVNAGDYTTWANHFGEHSPCGGPGAVSTPAVSQVPEPSALVFGGVGLLAIVAFARPKRCVVTETDSCKQPEVRS